MVENIFPAVKTYAPGVYKDLSFEEYKAIPAINASSLKPAAKSLLSYKYRLSHPWGGSSSTLLGSATHTLILEPSKFNQEYFQMPDFEVQYGTTKNGTPKVIKTIKAQEAEFKLSQGKKVGLSESQMDRVYAMAGAVAKNEEAQKFLRGTEREITLVWESQFGLCKARIDAYKSGSIVDVKTTEGVDYHSFSNTVIHFKYYLSMGFYQWGARSLGLTVDKATLIAVQSDDEHDVCCYTFDDDYLDLGKEYALHLLQKVDRANKTGIFTGYSRNARTLTAPSYLREQIYNQMEE